MVARAVANLNMLSELSIPFVKLNGIFIAMKGQNYQIELDNSKDAIAILGGIIDDKILYSLPKERITPSIYPRSYAKMKNKPL